jgi:hypothetical protein
MAVVIEDGDVVWWQSVVVFHQGHLNAGGSSVKRMWRASEVQAVVSLISCVKTSHVPSMFAALLVILGSLKVRPAMLPCFLRHFRLQIIVGNFVATF